ncbi:hypothetical protein HK096_000672 [Nowakowskiella sp. JEL0078]|nr:hypothetical protein HK096_000672 [Nowakowskiella sp. JEL0078]
MNSANAAIITPSSAHKISAKQRSPSNQPSSGQLGRVKKRPKGTMVTDQELVRKIQRTAMERREVSVESQASKKSIKNEKSEILVPEDEGIQQIVDFTSKIMGQKNDYKKQIFELQNRVDSSNKLILQRDKLIGMYESTRRSLLTAIEGTGKTSEALKIRVESLKATQVLFCATIMRQRRQLKTLEELKDLTISEVQTMKKTLENFAARMKELEQENMKSKDELNDYHTVTQKHVENHSKQISTMKTYKKIELK